MASGGRRHRSGPGADPNSQRQGRNAAAGGWVELHADQHAEAPQWPLMAVPTKAEEMHWEELWLKPQSVEWARLGLANQVALYVQQFMLAQDPESPVTRIAAVLRMEAELGISAAGMASLKWRIVDHNAVTRSPSGPATPAPSTPGTSKQHQPAPGAGARLRALKSA